MGTRSLWKWFIAVTFAFFLSDLNQSYAQNTPKIVAACAANPTVTTGVAFAVCTFGALAVDEIKTCLSGGDCFGENNELRKLFNTVGPNHDLFGCAGRAAEMVGIRCPDSYGPGQIQVVNKTGGSITFYYSQHGDAVEVNLPPGYIQPLDETWVNYRHNGPPTVGHKLRNGLTYNLVGSPQQPRLVCAHPRLGGGSFINDPADPCS